MLKHSHEVYTDRAAIIKKTVGQELSKESVRSLNRTISAFRLPLHVDNDNDNNDNGKHDDDDDDDDIDVELGSGKKYRNAIARPRSKAALIIEPQSTPRSVMLLSLSLQYVEQTQQQEQPAQVIQCDFWPRITTPLKIV
ncbi:uncharacterized protein Dvir_GJ26518 [Drosophila virilis]|uniref:Uncharacterized protein n=1 Tax=Drosophila virilis TaxID=7244 RepID=A0A0Q9WCD4_DROVI|nr:uncharacterized protein Dvir_GJ26518 [Drosophila virilis]